MSITLQIQLISKPEMTFDEMKSFISQEFPLEDNDPGFITSGNPEEGTVSLEFNVQDKLTDEQRDWLHISTFSARYIDGYKVSKSEPTPLNNQERFTQHELIMLDLAIIERRDRIRFFLSQLDTSRKVDKLARELGETDLERLEALHKKLSDMIEALDIKTENKGE